MELKKALTDHWLTIAADTYWRLPDLCNYVAFKIQAWLLHPHKRRGTR